LRRIRDVLHKARRVFWTAVAWHRFGSFFGTHGKRPTPKERPKAVPGHRTPKFRPGKPSHLAAFEVENCYRKLPTVLLDFPRECRRIESIHQGPLTWRSGVACSWKIRHKLLLGMGLVVANMALLLGGTLHGLASYRDVMGTTESKVEELEAAVWL